MVAASLRQIASRHDAQTQRESLQQNRHQIGNPNDRKQRVAEARAASQIGRPIIGRERKRSHPRAR